MTVAETTTTETAALLDELTRVLWRQRELIDDLQYRLEVQQLILLTSRAERLQRALSDVESAMDEIRRVERDRDLVVKDCAAALGLPENSTLTMLKNAVAEPWASQLNEHQEALLRQVGETERIASGNREFALRGVEETRGVLNEITGADTVTSYGPTGNRNVAALSRPALLDREA